MENLGLSLDYTYTDYGYINTIAQASESSFGPHAIDPNVSPYYSFYGVDAPEVRVSTQVVMLGLLYHW
jgi:hypothetical protein